VQRLGEEEYASGACVCASLSMEIETTK